MVNSQPSEFDFNHWSSLAQKDPVEFENQRQDAIDNMIEQAPAHKRTRLRRLQWKIDQARKLSGSPMAACIKLSNLMWESVVGRNGLLDALNGHGYQQPRQMESAQILSFPIYPEPPASR